ncbi:Fanconi-associated nuclease [Trichinella spiralis]|uniref:Fanconi-associated nuclease n=1 Tax=Trichinella spiralis TaxID=6334 RepID=A0ABR3L1Z4_TRISP
MVKGVEQFSTDNDPNGTKPWIKAAALRSTEPGHHYTADRSFKCRLECGPEADHELTRQKTAIRLLQRMLGLMMKKNPPTQMA